MSEPVGKLLARELAVRGWTQVQFAGILDRSAQLVCGIVGGKKEITRETAAQIAAATGTTAGFWLHQQNLHHLHAQDEDKGLQRKLAAIRERASKATPPEPAPAVAAGDFAEALRNASGMEPGGSQVYAPIYWDDVATELLAKFDIRPKPEGETP